MAVIFGLALAGTLCRPALATSLLNVTLGASTSPNGIEFTDPTSSGGMTIIIGACPFTAVTCTAGGAVTGGLTVGDLSSTYSLSGNSGLLATFAGQSNGVNTWTITTPTGAADSDSFFLGPSGSPQVTGSIDWTSVVENKSGVTLFGSVTYAGELGSGHVNISVLLSPLECNFAGQCSLGALTDVGGDPPEAFSTVGSGSFTSPTTTPEPGTLLLLGSGLTALGFIRRRFIRV
jgi:hypothetical protein